MSEKTAPIPCAKRFGGPGYEALGERETRGQDSRHELPQRAQFRTGEHPCHEPISNDPVTHRHPRLMANTHITTTPAATRRADTSLTGFGNENKRGTGPDPT